MYEQLISSNKVINFTVTIELCRDCAYIMHVPLAVTEHTESDVQRGGGEASTAKDAKGS